MRRLQLFELEDQPWFPSLLRTYLTDCLQRFYLAFLGENPLVDRFAHWLRAHRVEHVLDLCSGSSGPWLGLVERLADRHRLDLRVTLSDLYPNVGAFEAKRGTPGGARVDYLAEPVDALHPEKLRPEKLGFAPDALTIFAGLHHFAPEDARAILQNAVRRRMPIAVIEPTERSWSTLLLIPFLGLVVWALTPWLRPRDPRRWFFTYLVPLVPFGVVWDGIVSCLRAYTVEELREMTASIEALDDGRPGEYRWEIGQERLRGLPARVTWIFGSPVPRDRPSVGADP